MVGMTPPVSRRDSAGWVIPAVLRPADMPGRGMIEHAVDHGSA